MSCSWYGFQPDVCVKSFSQGSRRGCTPTVALVDLAKLNLVMWSTGKIRLIICDLVSSSITYIWNLLKLLLKDPPPDNFPCTNCLLTTTLKYSAPACINRIHSNHDSLHISEGRKWLPLCGLLPSAWACSCSCPLPQGAPPQGGPLMSRSAGTMCPLGRSTTSSIWMEDLRFI